MAQLGWCVWATPRPLQPFEWASRRRSRPGAILGFKAVISLVLPGYSAPIHCPRVFLCSLSAFLFRSLDVHYVPGEHDFLDEDIKLYRDRYGRGTKGAGYYSFDANGIHFIGLVNVVNLKAGGLGNLGAEQLEWLEQDLRGRSKSTPIVVFAHIPLWTVYPQWGWGTEDSAQALDYLKGFGSVTVLNGHIHQVMQKVEGNVTFHTARSTAFPQPAPGTAPSPGPMKVDDNKLRSMLGVASINFKRGEERLAIIDTPLQG